LIPVLRLISGIPAPEIHRGAQINRNNFRIAEELGRLPTNRNGSWDRRDKTGTACPEDLRDTA
jgi:hypothetical protein